MSKEQSWFHGASWLCGATVKAHASTDIGRFYKEYHAQPELWQAVFKFLCKDMATLEAGKYPLFGDKAFAMVSEYQTKKLIDSKWEAHRKYIDLQYVIEGEEKMGLLPLEKAAAPQGYDDTKDLIFFGNNEGEYFQANQKVFFLFFPSDVHRPGIQIEGTVPVKKLVIKIAVAGN
jgi:YhcH/YjgK/YiaL family protein